MKHDGRFPCISRQGELIMSLLELPCTLVGPKGRKTVKALFDSGASVSCIRKEVAEVLTHPEPLSEPFIFETADKGEFVQAKVGVFFSEIVGGCSCGDDPITVNAYCEILVSIDKKTAQAVCSIVTG